MLEIERENGFGDRTICSIEEKVRDKEAQHR